MMNNQMAIILGLVALAATTDTVKCSAQDNPESTSSIASQTNDANHPPSLTEGFEIADRQNLDLLLSSRFGRRQQGIRRIINQGADGIEWVRTHAHDGDLDFASCCVAILFEIGKSVETKQAAVEALESLSKDPTFSAAKLAKLHVSRLQENNLERVIRTLESEGVRLYRRGRNGEVTSASNVETDRQCHLLASIATVTSVSATGQKVTNRGLRSIAKIEALNNLSLFRTGVSDGGLHTLRNMPNLNRIALSGEFSVFGFRKLAAIPRLRHFLMYQPVEENELEVICQLQLETLHLGGVSLSDRSSQFFASMTQLRSLSVDLSDVENGDFNWIRNGDQLTLSLSITGSPKFDNEGLRQLSKTGISRLSLSGTGISREGIPILSEFPKLNSISITGTPLDDDAIQTLQNLKELRMLILRNTGVTQKGLERLQEKLPNLRYARTSG